MDPKAEMTWLREQMSAWQEIVFGLLMLVVGLFLEDWIDQWRERRRTK